MTLRRLMVVALLVVASAAMAYDQGAEQTARPSKHRLYEARQHLTDLQISFPAVKTFQREALTARLYGTSFSFGSSAEASAENFIAEHAGIFGVERTDLISGRPDKRDLLGQPVMYNDETGDYKFHLQYYRQVSNGVPVFQSELRLLTRNQANHPLVLAVSSLKDLDGFQADAGLKNTYSATAEQAARSDEPNLTDFSDQEVVVYAGSADSWATPRMAAVFEGFSDYPERFLFVVDLQTGEILHKENRIIFEDLDGNVQGRASEGNAADFCEDETAEALPWARLVMDGQVVYADGDGNFTFPMAGTEEVTVESRLWGQWFKVTHYTGTDEELEVDVVPPGPVNFLHNSSNLSEAVRAQVNAYVESNVVREFALAANPAYPQLQQNEFPVRTNRTDSYCPGNAWYDYSSLNFCASGSGYPNTAWSSVIHHEYGHHLINVGGSGQESYGEGMADCMSVLIADHPYLGDGFYGTCGEPLRNADNTFQYPCSGSIHYCGQLLSGCVWDTRDALLDTYPGGEYRDIIRDLTVNSILLHTGSSIDPSITIDFLTLDDDDGNLSNGTPHYWEIAEGFGSHNMDAPELALVVFDYPNGRPAYIAPGQSAVIEVEALAFTGEPVSGTGMFYYEVEGGATVSTPMTEIAPNYYQATLPPMECFQTIEYWFSVEAVGGFVEYDPEPYQGYEALASTGEMAAFVDGFESDMGWTVVSGNWERGIPQGNGGSSYGNPDPSSAYEGSYVLGYDLSGDGDYEAGMPEHAVISPSIDCSELIETRVRFHRWLNIEEAPYDHAYIRYQINGGTAYYVWDNDPEITDDSWVEYEYDISQLADGASDVRIQFVMGWTDADMEYSGWNIDNFQVVGISCDETPLTIVTPSLPDWTVDVAYSQQLQAANFSGTVTWTDVYDDLDGTGLTLSTAGLLSGTPVAAGPISFTARAEDQTLAVVDRQFSFTINPAVDISTTALPDWTVGAAYDEQLTATGGTGSRVWTDVYGNLTGSGLSLSTQGRLTGTPSSVGPISFTAGATDEVGGDDQQALTFTINPEPQITTTELPDAAVGDAYSQYLAVSGGTPDYDWSDADGSLDGSGLSLDNDGLLSGTPLNVQTLEIHPQVIDNCGYPVQGTLFLDILPNYICGDINADDVGPDIADLTYLVAFMFQQGTAPPNPSAADINGDGEGPDIADLIYLVAYMFNEGPDPVCEY